MSEPGDSEMNEPWLDMSAYPSLPPDDAVDGRVLDMLHAVLRAPEVTPLSPDAWSRALREAVTGGRAGHDHDPAPDGSLGHETVPEGSGPGGEHRDFGHDDPAHQGGWGSDWPGGHSVGQDSLNEHGDWSGQHDSENGGGHW